MRLDLPHRVAIIDLLPAVWTLVILQVTNRVSLPLEASGPVAADLSDFAAAARRTGGDFEHSHFLLKRPLG